MKEYVALPIDPKKPKTIILETEHRLFGFKCSVNDGSLAERETERRIRALFAVLLSGNVELQNSSNVPLQSAEIESLIPKLCDHLRPIYRLAEKELSTENILSDVFEYFAQNNLTFIHK